MEQEWLANSFEGKNALITGGTGLIGREVARMLIDAGANVRIVSLDNIQIDPVAEHVYGDLTDLSFCL